MASPPFDVSEIARLDEAVRTHKKEARRHQLMARLAAERRDELLAFARVHGIPIIQQTAQPEGHGHNDGSTEPQPPR